MGGHIPIAARFNDGQAICVDGYTNFIPNMIMNDTTLSGDDSVVKKTLLEVASHERYNGPQLFRAYGYGMLVIDFVTREIHSMQGYTSFSEKTLTQMFDVNASRWIDGKFVKVLSEQGKSLIEAGRVYLLDDDRNEIIEQLTCEKAFELSERETKKFMDGEGYEINFLKITLNPFAEKTYEEGTGFTQLREAMKQNAFPLNAKQGLNAMLSVAN
jgi:hypothetical protein